jgi:hypothetical protein
VTSLFLAAAPGTTWTLPAETFEEQLRRRFPDAQVHHADSRVADEHYIIFSVPLDGMPRGGNYSVGHTLVVNDGTPAEWADTLAWFLSLLPTDSGVVAMAENNPRTIVPVPRDSDAAYLQPLFEQLVFRLANDLTIM